jgi:hypothetical protein
MANEFFSGVISLFNNTLAAMWDIPVFRLLLLFMLFGAVYAVSRYLLTAVKSGVK